MSECFVCKTKQEQVISIELLMVDQKIDTPAFNINLMTCINGKEICDRCMDVYHKVRALLDESVFF